VDAAFRATLARIERRCPAFLALPVGQLSRDDLKRAGHHRGSVATLTRNECLWPVARRHRLQPAISCLSLGAAVDTLRPIAEASGKVNVLHPHSLRVCVGWKTAERFPPVVTQATSLNLQSAPQESANGLSSNDGHGSRSSLNTTYAPHHEHV